jgi:hypothetical protein
MDLGYCREMDGKETMRTGLRPGTGAKVWLGLVALAGLYFAYLVWSGFFAFDTCLDRGGVWNFDEGECSFTQQRGRGERPPLWPF